MKLPRILLPFALLIAAFALPAQAQDALSPAQQDEVRQIVKQYLLDNPDVLMDSLRAYQARQEQQEQMRQQAALENLQDELTQDPKSPVIGNPDGDVTVVEFMDYRCGYCKKVFPAVQDLIKSDGNIRYVIKEFPILGPDSLIASQAALAAWLTAPDKYWPFHTALMESRGGLTENKVLTMAEEAGLDRDSIRKKMAEPEITAILQRNREVASALGINGTPAFIIGKHLVPGAVSILSLRELVAAARKG